MFDRLVSMSFMTIFGFLGTIAPVARPVSLCSIVELNEKLSKLY